MTLTPDQTNELTRRLERLRSQTTVDGVVRLLLEAKITGLRRAACECPVANYLQADLPILATVSPVRCIIQDEEDEDRLIISREWGNSVVREFVDLFDMGHFPMLDAGKANFTEGKGGLL